jgi:restriction system protein
MNRKAAATAALPAQLQPRRVVSAPVPARAKSPNEGSPFFASVLRKFSRVYNAFRLRKHYRHRGYIRSAAKTLKVIRSFQGDNIGARVFVYLRKVDPTVFEEMVLTALQEGGRLVKRNLRYSGDGGSDGKFYEPGIGWMQVQTKRYGAHISAEHVRKFSELVKSTRCAGGIFVHTGRTGAAAWAPATGEAGNVVMVSGSGLLGLLLKSELP